MTCSGVFDLLTGIHLAYEMVCLHNPCVVWESWMMILKSGRGESDRLIIKEMRKHTGFNKESGRELQNLVGEKKIFSQLL